MNEKEIKSIKEYCELWISTTPEKECFTVRDIRKEWCAYVWLREGKRVMPYDDTFSRALRHIRAEGYEISYVDKSKAIWWRYKEPPKDKDEQTKLVLQYKARRRAF